MIIRIKVNESFYKPKRNSEEYKKSNIQRMQQELKRVENELEKLELATDQQSFRYKNQWLSYKDKLLKDLNMYMNGKNPYPDILHSKTKYKAPSEEEKINKIILEIEQLKTELKNLELTDSKNESMKKWILDEIEYLNRVLKTYKK